MSLYINSRRVSRVLLADGWHHVEPGSFNLDSYEYSESDDPGDGRRLLFSGGQEKATGIPATGFTFMLNKRKDWISGPLTSVLAVQHQRSE